MSNGISQLSIKNLLSGQERYIIPMYQRNYAWEEGEITQLIQDVIDYMPKPPTEGSPKEPPQPRPYYIGTLVVFPRQQGGSTVFETIDGQQRVTTLSLLASYLKNKTSIDLPWYRELKIQFESRNNSAATFAAIFNGSFTDDPSETLGENEINAAIINGYQLIQKILPQKVKENNITWQGFADYLFENVQIMRAAVPYDTDLNHYFEVMNNRGEQLEKHEVLKARMLEVLNRIEDEVERKASQNCLHVIWEACANMERYVQMGFTAVQRDAVFGNNDWGQFQKSNFDELREALGPGDRNGTTVETLNDIIAKPQGIAREDQDDDAPERFNSVINFPNFLLHVLRVMTQEDIPLDDKRLIDTFECWVIRKSDAITKVKQFVFRLLRCKYLFDQYVIKREFIKGTDGWSLKRLRWNDGGRGNYVNTFGADEDGNEGENRRILMLLSAFHVSTPTMVYKHWLNAALNYVFHEQEVHAAAYLEHLESVAKAFVFDRFLAEPGAEYYEIIYKNGGRCQAKRANFTDEALRSRLSFGNVQNNLVFNYLDYLLWLEHQESDPRVKSYEFTFRSSVEHYYPQHPMPGHDPLPPDRLNSFGNLCLISHSKNSRLSNLMPTAKKEYYEKNPIDSVKQHLMMQRTPWDERSIAAHYEAMKKVLLKSIDDDGTETEALV